jgi:hypothetical protein
MKFKNFYILLCTLTVFVCGCSINKSNSPAPVTPSGTFAGQFMFLHLHSFTAKVDTFKANLQLVMQPTTGFKITGDTSTVHAGSYGSYVFGSDYTEIDFIDKTYPATGTPVKNHLSGVYQYTYDGSTLQMVAYGPLDTLAYIYNMKKTGN